METMKHIRLIFERQGVEIPNTGSYLYETNNERYILYDDDELREIEETQSGFDLKTGKEVEIITKDSGVSPLEDFLDFILEGEAYDIATESETSWEDLAEDLHIPMEMVKKAAEELREGDER